MMEMQSYRKMDRKRMRRIAEHTHFDLLVYVERRQQQPLASPVPIQRRQVFHRRYPNVSGTVSGRLIGLRRKLCTVYNHQVALATNGARRKMHRSTERSSMESANK